MKIDLLDRSLASLIDAASPATLTMNRKQGSVTSPVWFRLVDDTFEVVIAAGDRKLEYLHDDPRCVLLIFEAIRPFRGIEVGAVATIVPDEGALTRLAIASRYLGPHDGRAYADIKRRAAGFVVRLPAHAARAWSLADKVP
jgi:hypothetical protein